MRGISKRGETVDALRVINQWAGSPKRRKDQGGGLDVRAIGRAVSRSHCFEACLFSVLLSNWSAVKKNSYMRIVGSMCAMAGM